MSSIPWELFWQVIFLSLLITFELVIVVRAVRAPLIITPMPGRQGTHEGAAHGESAPR